MKLTKSILKEIIREVIVEDWKISKSHGRGQSWTNYDQNNIRFQITKVGNNYAAWLSKLPSGPGKYIFDLVDLSKQDIEKIKDAIVTATNIIQVGKQINSKYKKYSRRD